MRRYHIQDRDDYKKYNKLCGMVTKLVRRRGIAPHVALRACPRRSVPARRRGSRRQPLPLSPSPNPAADARLRSQVSVLRRMDPRDSTRTALTDALLEKLYNTGAIPSRKSLALCDKLSTSSFCRHARVASLLLQARVAPLPAVRSALTPPLRCPDVAWPW
jgi:U3 small nucleolar ribonucleoprotein protein IMP3